MAEVTYEFVRGDDFVIPMTLTDPDNNGTPVDITGWTIASQVRYARKLIADLDVTITNAAQGEFSISLPKEQTAIWPVRKLKCDIQFDRPVEGRVSSQTFIIDCTEDQTQ
ncbi:hypothetical protein HL13_gp52 [Dinoroseobacter phage DFL12phi1]|uniref:Uncharacterized protein n=1 Tax=Dinoroseobacter phage DFL12phi1 TaxID=1477404 RepID=A0A023NI20_9CAUD|nr:hypothetical protein HL13_gp52 [Dinoroseobacter phage DFL12phi1]AHX01065.1 hypothetical protein DFL12P1_0052 [Dinoroseobacter phage DFL12phi1]